MKFRIFLPSLTSAMMLMGCAATPTLQYEKITDQGQIKGDEIDFFAFQRSQVILSGASAIGSAKDVKEAKDGNAAKLSEVSVAVQRLEHPQFRIAVRKKDGLGVSTSIKFSKVQNTALVSEVGTEVVDKRVETITKIGSGVVSLLTGLTATDADDKNLDPADLPITIDLSKRFDGAATGVNFIEKKVTIAVDPVPPDARPVTNLDKPWEGSSLVFSACRRATIGYTLGGKPHSVIVAVSDPNWYQSVAFPAKGKIAMHSQCGVSVEAERDAGGATEAALFEALAQQAKAIQDALEQRRKDQK